MATSKFQLTVLTKIASLITKIFHGQVPAEYRYFCRDTYVCKMLQAKYIFRDFASKKKYKTVSFDGEFGAELLFALPFAYWHYRNGTLKKTIGAIDTKSFYFFSEDHEEAFDERTNEGNYNYELPRVLYSHDYNMSKWLPVPYKERYKNDVYVFDKPLLIIASKYNSEWDGPPVHFFDKEMLDHFISSLKHKYTIVYNRPGAKDIVVDNSDMFDLNEFGWLRDTHPEVLLLKDLWKENKINAESFNHFQLCLYANCDNFISVHGGIATLASCFGGKNMIYSCDGGEHYFNCYQKLFTQLSGTEIIVAESKDELKEGVKNFL